jgi:hypothetical protein
MIGYRPGHFPHCFHITLKKINSDLRLRLEAGVSPVNVVPNEVVAPILISVAGAARR